MLHLTGGCHGSLESPSTGKGDNGRSATLSPLREEKGFLENTPHHTRKREWPTYEPPMKGTMSALHAQKKGCLGVSLEV